MIDLLSTLFHVCASCAPNANSFAPWGGLLGGGAGAGGGGAGFFKTGLAPKHLGELEPGDEGYADPISSLTVPNDLPLQDDGLGNAIPGAIVTGPIAGLEEAVALGNTGRQAISKVLTGAATAINDEIFQDFVLDAAAMQETPVVEDPNTFHMGKTMTNPDGSTINPDGTPGLPANRSPATYPDGTPATPDMTVPDPPD
jgi:hypothetical protein